MRYVYITSSVKDAGLVEVGIKHIKRHDKAATFAVVCNESDTQAFGDIETVTVGSNQQSPMDALKSLLAALHKASPEDNTGFVVLWPPVVLFAQLESDNDHEAVAYTTPGSPNVDMGAMALSRNAVHDMLLYIDKSDLPPRLDFPSLLTRVMLGALGQRFDLRNGDNAVQYAQMELLPVQPNTVYYNVAGPEILQVIQQAKLDLYDNMSRLVETVAAYPDVRLPKYNN